MALIAENERVPIPQADIIRYFTDLAARDLDAAIAGMSGLKGHRSAAGNAIVATLWKENPTSALEFRRLREPLRVHRLPFHCRSQGTCRHGR